MRERGGESVGEGDDDEVESNRKRQKFGVESKIFEEEVKPYSSLWKAKMVCPHGLDWGRQVSGRFWKGWTSVSRMGKTINGRRDGRKRGEGIPWCVKLTRQEALSG